MISIEKELLQNVRIYIAVSDIFGNEHTVSLSLGEVKKLPGFRAYTYVWIDDEKGSYPTSSIESFDDLLEYLKDD